MNHIFAFQVISSNSYRFWQEQTCILINLNGPTQVQSIKAGQSAILDIHMKMETDTATQRTIEYEVKQIFERIIKLEDYPSQMIKFNIIPQSKNYTLSSIINAVQLALLYCGIKLKDTICGIDQDQEKKFFQIDPSIVCVLSLTNDKVYYLDQLKMNHEFNLGELQRVGKEYKNWIKNQLVE